MAVKYLKRKTAMTKRKVYRRKPKRGPKKSLMQVRNIRGVVNNVLARKLETKMSCSSNSTYQQIAHNGFITLDLTLLKTTQGTADQMSSDAANRIGDEITLKGVSLKMMLELNERYSDVTFRIFVVRAARGDTPTAANLFTGLSGNKMMDSINKERYTVVAQKYVKLKAPNFGVWNSSDVEGSVAVAAGLGGGVYYSNSGGSNNYISRATKIVNLWIPGTKFGRNGLIKYENGGTSQKFFDYHVMVYAYSNVSTGTPFNVGAVSTYMKQMYYTDA